MKRMFSSSKGFTLIELLVVIAIIGLLASTVFASLGSARMAARTAKSIAELREIQKALEMYYAENNAYPSSGGNWDGLYSSYGDSTANWIPGLVPTYFSSLPRSPNNTTDGTRNYIYRSDTDHAYKLIWHGPEDCAGVKTKYPNLIDPVRDCWAYGFWSPAGAGY